MVKIFYESSGMIFMGMKQQKPQFHQLSFAAIFSLYDPPEREISKKNNFASEKASRIVAHFHNHALNAHRGV